MNKYRSPVWTEDLLRLQEVAPEREVRRPQPLGTWRSNSSENDLSSDTEEDAVVALTWPQETGWRYN